MKKMSQKNIKKNKWNASHAFFITVGIFLLLIVLPIAVGFLQRQQQTQQDAATPQSPSPIGVSGNWTMVFEDEFSNDTTLDTTKWNPMEGGSTNNVTTHASNVSVSGGHLILTLASATSGAEVCTCNTSTNFALPVGGYAEANIYFPGNGTSIYNWPAWWASGPNWPAAGENDIAEGLGTLTVNYHSPSGAHNQGTIPGIWSNGFHTYGLYRQAGMADVYWDGQLVKSYPTDDNGQGESLIINVGSGGTGVYGTGSQVLVNYVRAWIPCTTACSSLTSSSTPPAPTSITPTFNCLAGQPCTTSGPTQPEATLSPTQSFQPSQISAVPSIFTPTIGQAPVTQQPQSGQPNGNNGGIVGLLQLFIQFLMQLLTMLSGK